MYDITEEDEIQDEEDSIDIDTGEDETLEFEFIVEEDLNEENDYAVFVKVEEEDGDYCNEAYVLIDIKREKHNVVIQEMKVEPETAVCGDYIFVDMKIKNLGTSDEDVHILIENSELGISEKSEEFEIEKYDDNDEAERFFNIKIPENAEAGEYDIKVSVIFEDGQDSVTQSLVLEECKKTEKEIFETEKISLEGEKKEAKVEEDNNKMLFLVLAMSTFLILISLFCLFFPLL